MFVDQKVLFLSGSNLGEGLLRFVSVHLTGNVFSKVACSK